LYLKLEMTNLRRFRLIENCGDKIKLGVEQSRNNIIITIPFTLDEKAAKLVGMMPDGTISRNLSQVVFWQKKDLTKVDEFKTLVEKLFGIEKVNLRVDKTNSRMAQASSKPLAIFMNNCLGVSKSDEPYRVPWWIMNSPMGVVKTYVSEVFAMEGSVCDPRTGKKEARLHSCDLYFVEDMQRLLKERLNITSSIFTYYISGYGNKYYLMIKGRENLLRLRDVGIALESHQQRLDKVCESYKPEAWKISLVAASKFQSNFTSKDMAAVLGISTQSTLWRIKQLRARGLVVRGASNPPRYSLTEIGRELVSQILPTVKIQPVRTKPHENEAKVKAALCAGLKKKHDIARFTHLTHTTVREVLARMAAKSSA